MIKRFLGHIILLVILLFLKSQHVLADGEFLQINHGTLLIRLFEYSSKNRNQLRNAD